MKQVRSIRSKPEFAYWRKFAVLPAWQLASILAGYDPRALSDIAGEDGQGVDLSSELAMLTAALTANEISAAERKLTSWQSNTDILVASTFGWMRSHGFSEVATGLESGASGGAQSNKRWTPELVASLKAFRQGHTAAETAVAFGISESRIRVILAKDRRAAAIGNSVFNVGKDGGN